MKTYSVTFVLSRVWKQTLLAVGMFIGCGSAFSATTYWNLNVYNEAYTGLNPPNGTVTIGQVAVTDAGGSFDYDVRVALVSNYAALIGADAGFTDFGIRTNGSASVSSLPINWASPTPGECCDGFSGGGKSETASLGASAPTAQNQLTVFTFKLSTPDDDINGALYTPNEWNKDPAVLFAAHIQNTSSSIIGAGSLWVGAQKGTGPLETVPIPAAVWLFGSALLGLIGMSRRSLSAFSV